MLSDNLKIESVELFSRDNAREHRTERYELVFDTGRVIALNYFEFFLKFRIIVFFCTGIIFRHITCFIFTNLKQDIGSPSSMAMSRSMTNMASMSSMSPMLSMDYRSSSSSSTTVLRRGQPFFMAVRMRDRNFDPRRDILRASFTFGTLQTYRQSRDE